ncbi:class I SAM-dependent methyltransferase [Bordetella genomosp. 11]|uniref:Methyltransferase domain-containing protein n=1 Tax=Bordetella genomosp. 11 TaxID=1416808 RepID=A0A261UM62_9BORD|nr:class I SAM-dependent methyltransferase [Bordetella genomosp. 11]OZI62968.1 hypothetical protein CAL28_28040 [Bordetella genomosp. 11]
MLMSENLSLSTHPEYVAWHAGTHRLQYLNKCIEHYYSTPLIPDISTADTMYNEWYLQVGHSAAANVMHAFQCSWLMRVNRALDMACGHGRVLRHLVNLFPDAEFHACDLDREGVDFCQETFGIKGIYSVEDLTKVDFVTKYDLIWVGSLFTHTSQEITKKWLSHLTQFLTETGIMIATFHGRWSETVAAQAPYINPQAWSEILSEYRATGYGYRDYERSENHQYIQGSYGISLSSASAIAKIVEAVEGVRIFSYQERAWADHQDVMVIGKPAHNMAWK